MNAGTVSCTLTGTGFTSTEIGSKTYINGGTVNGISVSANVVGAVLDATGLAVSDTSLGNALVADFNSTNAAAVENIFLRQVWDDHRHRWTVCRWRHDRRRRWT